MTTNKKILTLTFNAIQRLSLVLSEKPEGTGLRIGVKTKGCSGLAYTMTYASQPEPFDDVIEEGHIKIFIDPKAIFYILGSEMDYVQQDISSGFVFTNPNEKGKCGCGKSFYA
jgi:iron-sulfur cluster assembly accessory protein